jgi:MoaA/NifB/PqqE/SkfB family radical SAM enzyme
MNTSNNSNMPLLTVDINGSCNLECAFCYQKLDGSFLSKAKVLQIADRNPDVESISIGGGEPFLHRDILQIISDLRDNGRKVHIATNATWRNYDFLRLEEKVREGVQLQVSIPASNPQLYHSITGQNLFLQVLDNIGELNQKYATQLSTVIYERNFEDVPAIIGLSKKLNLPIRVNLAFPVGKGASVKKLEPDQIEQLRGYLLGQNLKTCGLVDSPLLHPNNCRALASYYNLPKQGACPADLGMKRYLSPRGEASACEFAGGRR